MKHCIGRAAGPVASTSKGAVSKALRRMPKGTHRGVFADMRAAAQLRRAHHWCRGGLCCPVLTLDGSKLPVGQALRRFGSKSQTRAAKRPTSNLGGEAAEGCTEARAAATTEAAGAMAAAIGKALEGDEGE